MSTGVETPPAAASPRPAGRSVVRGTARPELLFLAALVAAGAALRFPTLDLQSFWHDEAVTVGRVLDPSLWTTLDRVPGSEATPPLYYALAWLWTRPFGAGEVGIRSLSAVIGVATIPVAWWAGRVLVARAAGLAAAALVAFSPYMVWYSQEARAYALLILLCGVSLALFGEVLRRAPEGRRFVVWWAVASALALCAHYFAAFVVVPELLLMLWLAPERRRAVLAAGAAVGAVGLALVPLAKFQADQGHDVWITRIPLDTRLRDTAEQFVLGYTGSPARALSVVTALVLLAAVALAVRGGFGERGWRLAVGVGAAALLAPLVAKPLGADYLYPRNMVGAWVVLAVVLGAAAAARAGAVAVGALCAAFLALTIAFNLDEDLQRADWRGAAEAIGPATEARAIVTPAVGDDPIAYYADGARLPRGSAVVRQIEVLGFSAAPGARDRRVPPGFRAVARERAGRFTLVRYRVPRARRLGRPELAAAGLGIGHTAVVVQRP